MRRDKGSFPRGESGRVLLIPCKDADLWREGLPHRFVSSATSGMLHLVQLAFLRAAYHDIVAR